MLLKEVEVSVTERCSLACAHCGFMVPNQPRPSSSDPARDLELSLAHLSRLGFTVGSLAVLGGEATLARRELAQTLRVARAAPNVGRIELVTNGLTPAGLDRKSLPYIDRLSLSDYTDDDRLASAWRLWLSRAAPEVEFRQRRHKDWDRWHDPVELDDAATQTAYDSCWYRRHCVTLERGRLFMCSRVPKLGLDHQGIVLESLTTREDVLRYLHKPEALPACRTCTPVAGLLPVQPGLQPDDRLVKLQVRALAWFSRQGIPR